MKERPILFSASMVLALLAGTKTQTRRIVKPQPTAGLTPGHNWFSPLAGRGGVKFCRHDHDIETCSASECVTNPYGWPGDRLWVKESIRRIGPAVGPEEYAASEFIADGAATLADAWPWKNKALPSIHMPKGLSRLTLEVTGVRVERLNDIREADAKAEGIECISDGRNVGWLDYSGGARGEEYVTPVGRVYGFASPVESYRSLWESINGADSWALNPWVWVVEFKRVTP